MIGVKIDGIVSNQYGETVTENIIIKALEYFGIDFCGKIEEIILKDKEEDGFLNE